MVWLPREARRRSWSSQEGVGLTTPSFGGGVTQRSGYDLLLGQGPKIHHH